MREKGKRSKRIRTWSWQERKSYSAKGTSYDPTGYDWMDERMEGERASGSDSRLSMSRKNEWKGLQSGKYIFLIPFPFCLSHFLSVYLSVYTNIYLLSVSPNCEYSMTARYTKMYCLRDWTKKFRWDLKWATHSHALTKSDWTTSGRRESMATKVPVLPTPALQWTKRGPLSGQ